MNKQWNSNWLLLALVVCTVLFFLVFPVSIEVKLNTAAAQETSTETPQIVDYTLVTTLGGTPPMAFVGSSGH